VDTKHINKHGVQEDLVHQFPSGKPTNASKYAGKEMPLSDELKNKYDFESVSFTPEGYPDFEKMMRDNDIKMYKPDQPVKIKMSGDSDLDIAEANFQTTGFRTKKPEGFEDYTWHHSHDGKTMILVPTDLHKYVKHFGGDAITRAAMGLKK
jgi:hypothetical protein